MQEEVESLKQRQDQVSMKLSATTKELETSKEDFSNTKTAFNELKIGSKDYLALKAAHGKATILLEKQKIQIVSMEAVQLKRYIYFFLAGAGVVLVTRILDRQLGDFGEAIFGNTCPDQLAGQAHVFA